MLEVGSTANKSSVHAINDRSAVADVETPSLTANVRALCGLRRLPLALSPFAGSVKITHNEQRPRSDHRRSEKCGFADLRIVP